MQLKLLNLYRVAAKIATNIVGAFIALIIYQSTGSFAWAFTYVAAFNLFKIFLHKLLRKACQRKPQLMLLLKTIPMLLYSFSVLLLDTQFKVLGIFLVLIFKGLSDTLVMAVEFIYSYNSDDKSSTSTGFTRLMDILGAVIAILVGGLLLDNIDTWIVIVLSCVIYVIGVIPLCIFALKQRGNKAFNQEATSNAIESYNTNDLKRHQHKFISKRVLSRYFLAYILLCSYDAVITLVGLYIFKENVCLYSQVAYISIAFHGMYGIGGMIAGYLDQKKDLTYVVVLSYVVGGILVCISPFLINYIWAEILLYGAVGFMLSFMSLFLYSRLMTRCKIMGIGNQALSNREISSYLAQALAAMFCIPGAFMFIPTFFILGISSIANGYFVPKNEEVVRRYLVDYLQNNNMYQ